MSLRTDASHHLHGTDRRAGETRTKLQTPKGGLTNENFPEPR